MLTAVLLPMAVSDAGSSSNGRIFWKFRLASCSLCPKQAETTGRHPQPGFGREVVAETWKSQLQQKPWCHLLPMFSMAPWDLTRFLESLGARGTPTSEARWALWMKERQGKVLVFQVIWKARACTKSRHGVWREPQAGAFRVKETTRSWAAESEELPAPRAKKQQGA